MSLGQFRTQKRGAGRQVEPDNLIAQRGIDPAPRRPTLEETQIGPAAQNAFGEGLRALC